MASERAGHICFIGGGTMGCYNALLAALGGHDAVIYDISGETLNEVSSNIAAIAVQMVGADLIEKTAADSALSRITTQADLGEALSGAWLVSESIFENLEVKRTLFADIESKCDKGTLLTTNSSSLMVSDIESALVNGSRFAALHSHLGAMLFDIVPGPRTEDHVVDILRNYVSGIGGMALVQHKENKGYVFNAMIGPVLATAMLQVIDGAATIHDVDRAWMARTASPMGPFGMMDLFGTALIYDSWKHQADDPARRLIRFKILSFLAPIVGSGKLGIKSGHGFYCYPGPAYAKPGFITAPSGPDMADHALTSAWTQNAVLLAANEIAAPIDIDRAWMVATRQPRGPFGVLDDIGLDRALLLFGVTGPLAGPQNTERIKTYLMGLLRRGKLGKKSGSGFYDYPDPEYAADGFLQTEGQ